MDDSKDGDVGRGALEGIGGIEDEDENEDDWSSRWSDGAGGQV